MAKDYTRVPAVFQFDRTACWAASLEWWASAMGNRPCLSQLDVMHLFQGKWDANDAPDNSMYGTVTVVNFVAILRDSRWGMACENIPGSSFTCFHANQRMRLGPCIVGYYDNVVRGKHVVAAYGASNTHVACMDPNGGLFTARPISYFNRSDEIILGWPIR